MWRKNYIRSLLSVPLLVLFAPGSVQAQGNVQLSPDILTVAFQKDISGNPVGFVSLSLISGDSDTNLFVFRLELAGFGIGSGATAVFISPTSTTISSVNVTDVGGFSNLTFLLQVPDRVDLQLVTTTPSAVGTLEIQFVDTPTEITFFNQTTPVDSVTAEVIVRVAVGIDIHPGSFPNSINLGSGGVTPVAILGSASLDVNDIDVTTLTLGTAGIKTVGKTLKILCSVEDVSGDFTSPEGAPDGFDDLVCKFITVDLVPEAGNTTAKLSGNLNDGTAIEGSDSVNIVP